MELIAETARCAVFAGPPLAYVVTRRFCLGLQLGDLRLLQHGLETGIIRQLPSGGYAEETRPLPGPRRDLARSG